jgi:patatin-related protein
LATRDREWPGRAAFITRQLMPGLGDRPAEDRILIDGSVLANAPFKPAIAVLKQRPARREVDRRFVYIDPKPEFKSFSFGRSPADGKPRGPGFFATILAALSEIPRSQPIRDNIDALSGMSMRIRRMRHIVDSMQTEVEDDVTALFGRTFFLDQPTTARLAAWSRKAQHAAAERAGYAYAGYGHLKLSQIVEDLAATAARLTAAADDGARETVRTGLWAMARARGLDRIGTERGRGTNKHVIAFFRAHDLGYRIRRLRFLARQLDTAIEAKLIASDDSVDAFRDVVFAALGRYFERESDDFLMRTVPGAVPSDPAAFLDWVAASRDLIALDTHVEQQLASALAALPREHRRAMLFAFLGFPFYDVATLPLLQGEGQDEYDPIKVDRISPSDAVAIRRGGARDTLKGTQFNTFGAFFSRAYRENDYLWGRLHGADRLADIVASAIGGGAVLPIAELAAIKNRLFHAILDEEAARLPHVAPLIAQLRREIGGG